MKKGILIVPFMTGYGGTETVIKNLFETRKQHEQPFKLKVYSIGGSFDYSWAKDVDKDVKWISKSRKIRDLYALTAMPLAIMSYLKRERPDFVISTNPVIWFLIKKILNLLKSNAPVIAWYHYSISQKPIKKIFLNSADYYLAISSGIKKQLVKSGINPSRIFLIFNPVTTDRHLIKRPKDKVKFIYLGRLMLDGQKNLRELFKALSKVRGNWSLELYGSEKEAQAVKEYAEKVGIDSKIVWHGFVNNPWEAINDATALVLTSKYEGLPMVLCEAISHGVYTVSANTSTGPEDIVTPDNGKLYPLGKYKELRAVLQSIVNGDHLPDQSAIQNTAQKFSPDSYVARFNNAIMKIIK